MKSTRLKSSLTWTTQAGRELLRCGEGDREAFLIPNALDAPALRALAAAAVEAADWLEDTIAIGKESS